MAPSGVAERFRSFDTICSATQERQDAVLALLDEPLDVMVVVGGYNSSNTCHLAALVQSRGVRTYHIEDADGHRYHRHRRHPPSADRYRSAKYGPTGGCRSAGTIGITAGASTPNNKIGETIVRICELAGVAASSARAPAEPSVPFLDLSHTVVDGMITYPGLPGPIICDFLSREASRGRYAPGVEFQIGKIEMVANTGTYIDSPFHRYAHGKDLAGLPLESLADLDAVVIQGAGRARGIGPEAFEGHDVSGRAVLVRTGWDVHWGTPRYLSGNPYLTAEAAEYLGRVARCWWESIR